MRHSQIQAPNSKVVPICPAIQLSKVCGNHTTNPPAQPASTSPTALLVSPPPPLQHPGPVHTARDLPCALSPLPHPELFKLSRPQLFLVPGPALSAETPMKAVAQAPSPTLLFSAFDPPALVLPCDRAWHAILLFLGGAMSTLKFLSMASASVWCLSHFYGKF